tara:strand:+ start:216 stop:803 length:588 start_codon:yes stop_codon:yes gene_type:complete
MDKEAREQLEEIMSKASLILDNIGKAPLEKRKLFDWKEYLSTVWAVVEDHHEFIYPNGLTESFLTQIWKISDIHVGELIWEGENKQVQAIVDDKNDLYLSTGSAYLSHAIEQHEDERNGAKIQFPIKCWIQTKPDGVANLESLDHAIINEWRTKMTSCIVLGDNEYLAYDIGRGLAKKAWFGTLAEDTSTPDFID